MSTTFHRTTSACPSEGQGLQLDKFLDTLDWASESHPRNPQSSQKSCIACKSTSQPSIVEQLPISIEHLRAHATFCVARHHRISFSPRAPGLPPLSQVPAILSIEDAKLRLSLSTTQDGAKRCLTIHLDKLISGPELNHREDILCLQFVFPLLTLLLERPRRDTNASTHDAARVRELQFAAMKEAVVELRDMPSSNNRPFNSPEGANKGEHVSLFAASLEKLCEQEETKNMSLEHAFTNFMNQGAEMVMPLCFPYNRATSPPNAIGNTCAHHAAFVDAYMMQEAVWRRTIKQVDAALHLAKRQPDKKREKDGEHTGETDEIFRVEALNGDLKPP